VIDERLDRNPGCKINHTANVVAVVVRRHQVVDLGDAGCFATPAMRSASRARGPAVSTNSDCRMA